MPERRKYPRTKIDPLAQICIGNRNINCRLVDVSSNGLAIEVADARMIPNRFQLKTEYERVVFDCRIVWVKQNRIGLIFE